MPLSEYEKKRLENIKRNQELLRELEIPQLDPLRKRSATPIKKHTPKKAPKKEKQEPTRQSARLRGIKAENVPPPKSEPSLYRSSEKKAERIDRLDDDQQQEFLAILRQMPNTRPAPREANKQDVETQSTLRNQLEDLEIRHEWATVKVTPDRINCSVFHPSSGKILACAGDTAGNLGFWDVNGTKENDFDDEKEPVIYAYRPHTRTITDLHFDPTDISKLYTSSYDGTIQYFDMQQASFHSVSVDSYSFTNFDFCDKKIWFSTSDGEVGSYDLRSNKTHVHELRQKKIGCIHINPKKSHLLAAASNDRTLTIWDARSFKSPLHEVEHGYAVTSAYWSPLGNKLATTSYDDHVRVFDLDKSDELSLLSAIPHNNHTGKWVTMFRTRWNQNPAALSHQHFIVGNMKRTIDFFSGETGQEMCALSDPDRLTAIQAVAIFHPSTEKTLVATGNASGRMACWS